MMVHYSYHLYITLKKLVEIESESGTTRRLQLRDSGIVTRKTYSVHLQRSSRCYW